MKKTSISERARWNAYFFLDALRGGPVRKKMEENRHAYLHGTDLTETDRKIRALIAHAAETTAYYRPFGPEASLQSLPVVDKNIFRERYADFQSSACLHARGNRIMTTSGSTGTPLSMVQDRGKILANTADAIFLESLAGYHIGEKLAFIRVWVRNVRKSKLALFAENSVMMDSSSLSDESIADMLATLKRQKVRVITGYSSALSVISDYIERKGIDTGGFSVHAILPISETMPEPVREQLKRQFGCTVQQTYSNEENGIMGIQSASDNSYYINSESYFYELLKLDSDEPAEDGELGRIVITDLTNYAFPVIRYDNGDTAVAEKTVRNGRSRLILKELYGRRSDLLYDTKGRAVTPYVITNNLWNVDGVGQYRFLQTGLKNYELRLCGDREKMNVDDMLSRIRPAFGPDAIIDVRYVDEIPVLSSGKRKYIENLCPEYRK